ncbi:hypothetical protein WH47_06170 [Habropoda laboriosa]|uniref:Uncharacterized protein n=1 Tax=Habropoda laboriosa TaxID=597456 RepID=A0A0L7QSB1_9HYME|nr:hypothetical protein WH47_06170 [Habropoda laboriosa]
MVSKEETDEGQVCWVSSLRSFRVEVGFLRDFSGEFWRRERFVMVELRILEKVREVGFLRDFGGECWRRKRFVKVELRNLEKVRGRRWRFQNILGREVIYGAKEVVKNDLKCVNTLRYSHHFSNKTLARIVNRANLKHPNTPFPLVPNIQPKAAPLLEYKSNGAQRSRKHLEMRFRLILANWCPHPFARMRVTEAAKVGHERRGCTFRRAATVRVPTGNFMARRDWTRESKLEAWVQLTQRLEPANCQLSGDVAARRDENLPDTY